MTPSDKIVQAHLKGIYDYEERLHGKHDYRSAESHLFDWYLDLYYNTVMGGRKALPDYTS